MQLNEFDKYERVNCIVRLDDINEKLILTFVKKKQVVAYTYCNLLYYGYTDLE